MRIERTRSDPAPGRERRRRRPTSPPTRTGGTARRSTAATPPSGARCARAQAASCGSTPTASCRATSTTVVDLTGVAGNFWLGLALLHTLFTHEHNAICDRLKAEYPRWSDDELFERARLVNAALMAKIHTVEWTPAIIAHPTTKYAMHANWYGILGERLHKRSGKRSSNEVLSGILGSPTDHHGVPYSLTEEFVAVYRMHPLMPDDFTFRSIDDRRACCRSGRSASSARSTPAPGCDEVGFVELVLLVRRSPIPGAITLHNYPRFLQEFERPDGTVVDLAAIDILRIRERGVPRYNDFRQLLPPEAAAHVRGADRQPGVGGGAASASTATSSAST